MKVKTTDPYLYKSLNIQRKETRIYKYKEGEFIPESKQIDLDEYLKLIDDKYLKVFERGVDYCEYPEVKQ